MTTRPSTERGFVLIGVVMFVLALTILGLSIFSLSSYEGQFMNRTLDESRAFYLAQGGIERAKAVLGAAPGLLTNVKQSLPYEGVTYAVAMQRVNPTTVDSTGPLNWAGDTVTIIVRAQVRNESRMLQAQFLPQGENNYYKRLFTSAGEVFANFTAPVAPTNRCGTVALTGQVWQNAADTSWASDACLTWNGPRPVLHDGVPVPLVGSFFAQNVGIAGPALVDSTVANLDRIELHAPVNGVAYFVGPIMPGPIQLPLNLGFGFFEQKKLEVSVRGTAVWLLQSGMRTEQRVTITKPGSAPATLVIVAGLNLGYQYDPPGPPSGIWMFGGVNAEPGISVFMVSLGRVWIEQANDPTFDNAIDGLAVFANGIHVLGPQSGRTLDLRYNSALDGIIDGLISGGVLPAAAGATSGELSMIPGTWRELTP